MERLSGQRPASYRLASQDYERFLAKIEPQDGILAGSVWRKLALERLSRLNEPTRIPALN